MNTMDKHTTSSRDKFDRPELDRFHKQKKKILSVESI